MQTTQNIIQRYYDSFNRQDMDTFLNFLDTEVVHDINQSGSKKGKQAFADFMKNMNRCYNETVRDLVIMASADGMRAAAEFIVEGTYLITDSGLPEAKGQQYSLPAGAFFSLENGKITRVTTYYNLKDWLNQVAK